MKSLGIVLFLEAAFVLFSGCAKDDSTSSPSANGAVIATSDGSNLLLKQIISSDGTEDVKITYDEDWRPTNLSVWDEIDFQISYDPYSVKFLFDDYFDIDFTFNGDGYVTKLTASADSDPEGDENWSAVATGKYSYDSNGHLTGVSYCYEETDTWDGESETYYETADVINTWSHGNLTESASTVIDDYGEDDHETWREVYTVEYGEDSNEYSQPTTAYSEIMADSGDLFAFGLMFLGYFGKGTYDLPVSYTSATAWDEEDLQDDWSISCSYTKNDDGTVRTEVQDYGYGDVYTYTYSYYTLENYTRAGSFARDESRSAVAASDLNRIETFRKLFATRRFREKMENCANSTEIRNKDSK